MPYVPLHVPTGTYELSEEVNMVKLDLENQQFVAFAKLTFCVHLTRSQAFVYLTSSPTMI